MRVHAIVVTYRRPVDVRTTMAAILRQTRPPDPIWIIDNDPTNELRAAASQWAHTRYVAMPTNAGPAGGIAAGMKRVLDEADDDDWILLVDDDDPPTSEDAVDRLLAIATDPTQSQLAAVGVVGARFDRSRARLERISDDELGRGPIDVDYIGGGHLPLYRVSAVRSVGVVDEQLFFGFEDLEFGLRLRGRGWRLVADGDLWFELRRAQGRLGRGRANHNSSQPPWRRYYSTRNLIGLARRYGTRGSIVRAVLRSGCGGAARSLIADRSVRGAIHSLRGAIDGLRRVSGRTLLPPDQPS